MKQLTCEMCGSTDLVKQDGFFVCQTCGTKYSVEEAKKMMIEGTVDVQGTVKVDNSQFVEKYLANARRAMDKTDWEEAEKYYNLVEQNSPNNIEALFFSAYAKLRQVIYDPDSKNKERAKDVLVKSMSVISDYYETTTEDKKSVLEKIDHYIKKLANEDCVRYYGMDNIIKNSTLNMFDYNPIANAFSKELDEIYSKHQEDYIQVLRERNVKLEEVSFAKIQKKIGIFVGVVVGIIVFVSIILAIV